MDRDGYRPRYFGERKKLAAQQGSPLRDGVSTDARGRLVREVFSRSGFYDRDRNWTSFADSLMADMNRVFGKMTPLGFNRHTFEHEAEGMALDDFLQAIEMCAERIERHRETAELDMLALQSILADDLSMYRFAIPGPLPKYQIVKIDNEHLHTVITDRTFELTRVAEFAAAQGDYADAWRHYSKGDTDDAVSNAHKAVESACKVIIKRLDPTSDCEQKHMNQLVPELVRLDVLPSRMQNVVTGLNHIFTNSGSLRNQAGAAHGSLDPTSPEASTALLALRLSGTLIAFLAERWGQMKS